MTNSELPNIVSGVVKVIPNRLRVLRAERRISQVQIARRMGISQSKVSQIENGYDEPSKDELKKLARILGVHPSELGFQVEAISA